MTAFLPEITAAPAVVIKPTGPKLVYEIGDGCWVSAGMKDKAGNVIKSPGLVVYWFDLPDFASRFYVIKLFGDYMHLVVRDALLMVAHRDEAFPFAKTRHDNAVRPDLRVVEWRQ